MNNSRQNNADPPTTQLIRMGVNVQHWDFVVALAGNPNVGKSTVFNALTGLRQHTGNWPGKTVTRAEGGFHFDDAAFKLVDLPGTYSLLATSADEEVARNFILFGQPDVTVIVVDASRLERNLNLALQVLEITDRAVICLNLIDEAERHHVQVDAEKLSKLLGVPVVATSARYDRGIDELLATVADVASGRRVCKPRRVGIHSPELQQAVDRLSEPIEQRFPGLRSAKWVALRLLDGDGRVAEAVRSGELTELAQHEPTAEDPTRVDEPSTGSADTERIMQLASSLRWDVGRDFHQTLTESIYTEAADIADRTVRRSRPAGERTFDRKLDRLLTSRWLGFPIMGAMLAAVLWITVSGANVPSGMLASLLLDTVHPWLKGIAATLRLPWWLDGVLIDGVYLAAAWVIAVMLPPMAIFFPLFTLLEDFGYLPRVAFNLDSAFRRCGGHGKQALTMCMGFGCNAAGIVATRVIDSPRERLIAIISNNFSLCNGRWPTQILIATIFIGSLAGAYAGTVATAAVVGVALLGVAATFGVSWLLSRTMLKGEPSAFSMELPPYRPPRLLQTLYTSLIDRTIFVLWRAIVFAVPAGAVIWIICNVRLGNASLAEHAVGGLDPVGLLFGLNGVILLAYIVAIPANEIVIPTVLMLTVMATGISGVGEQGDGVMFELDSARQIGDILRAAGWTTLTGVCLMLFSLMHNPCSTTIYTIWKETGSVRWTAVATLLPVVMGFALCLVVAQVWLLLA